MYSRNKEVYWLWLLEFFASFLLICTYPFSICVCWSAVLFLGWEPDYGGPGCRGQWRGQWHRWHALLKLGDGLLKARLVHLFLARPVHLLLSYTSVTCYCSILEMSRWLDVCCPTTLLFLFETMWFSFSRWQDGLLAAALHDFESQNLDASKVVLV